MNSILLHHCSMIEPSMTKKKKKETIPCPRCCCAPPAFRSCSFSCYRIDWISTGYLRQHPLIQEFLDREVLSLHAYHRKARFPLP